MSKQGWDLHAGICDCCNKGAIHRHRMRDPIHTDGWLWACRACSPQECENCGTDSALWLFESELKQAGISLDMSNYDQRANASGTVEFAERFLAQAPEYLSLRKAYNKLRLREPHNG